MSDEQSETKNGWFKKITSFLNNNDQTHDPHHDFITLLKNYRAQHNNLDEESALMMLALLDLSDTQVRDIMIPRGQITLLQSNWSFEKIITTIIESGHSRYPVLDEESEKILGILISKDLLPILFHKENNKEAILERLRPANLVPESKALESMLRDFKSTRSHMALVIDEYGNLSGLLTIEDIIEEIVGEIDDEHDEIPDENCRALDKNNYQVKALMPIEEFNVQFDTTLPDEDSDTIGGYVLQQFGRMPTIGEHLNLAPNWKITIQKATQRRLILLKLSREE